MPAHPFAALIALFPAACLLLAPGFVNQYEQRLGGAADELDIVVRHFDEDARRSGYDRESALRIMTKNPERLIRDQAVSIERQITRLSRLRAHEEALKREGSFGRLISFAVSYDQPLVERTRQSYKLSLTIDGALFGGIGFFGLYFLMAGLANAMRRRDDKAHA